MNMVVGALTFVPLLTVAFAHLHWAHGSSWPIRDQMLLAQTVVGTPGIARGQAAPSTGGTPPLRRGMAADGLGARCRTPPRSRTMCMQPSGKAFRQAPNPCRSNAGIS